MAHIAPLFHNSGLLWRRHELDEIIAIKDRGDGGPERSMTAAESRKFSCALWHHGGAKPVHDFSHLCFGYMLEDIQEKVSPYEYQGSDLSEVGANAVNYVLDTMFFAMMDCHGHKISMMSKFGFAEKICQEYEKSYAQESHFRTVAWIAGGKTGQTYDQIRNGYNIVWSSTQELAEHHRIKLGNDSDVFWGSERYTIGTYKTEERLPEGSNGVENFYPYLPPTPEEIDALYTRTTRLYNFLVSMINTNRPSWDTDIKTYEKQIFSTLLMNDVVAAIRGEPPNPTPLSPSPRVA